METQGTAQSQQQGQQGQHGQQGHPRQNRMTPEQKRKFMLALKTELVNLASAPDIEILSFFEKLTSDMRLLCYKLMLMWLATGNELFTRENPEHEYASVCASPLEFLRRDGHTTGPCHAGTSGEACSSATGDCAAAPVAPTRPRK